MKLALTKFGQRETVEAATFDGNVEDIVKLGIVAWMQTFQPKQVYHYFDRLRIYVKDPLNHQWIAALQKVCGAVSSEVGPTLFDPRYRQKLEIYQPNPAALKLLGTLPADAIVCNVEIACDVVCADACSLFLIAEGFLSGFLQPQQRDKKSWAYYGYTDYVTGFTTRKNPERNCRRQGFWFQWYIDKPCRITKEPHCFHFEGKYEGRQAVMRIHIFHPRDLERFDFVAYFTKYASKLYRVDSERLGRCELNRLAGTKRKKPQIDPWGYNRDRRTGQTIYRAQSLHPDRKHRSLHCFVGRCGRGPFLKTYRISFMVTGHGRRRRRRSHA